MIRFANASKAQGIQMRIYGTICAVSGVSLFAIYLANGSASDHGKADLYIVEYAIAFLILAAGLLTLTVWAELIFNLCLLLLSVGIAASLVVNRETDPGQIFLDLAIIALLMTLSRNLHSPLSTKVQYFLRGA